MHDAWRMLGGGSHGGIRGGEGAAARAAAPGGALAALVLHEDTRALLEQQQPLAVLLVGRRGARGQHDARQARQHVGRETPRRRRRDPRLGDAPAGGERGGEAGEEQALVVVLLLLLGAGPAQRRALQLVRTSPERQHAVAVVARPGGRVWRQLHRRCRLHASDEELTQPLLDRIEALLPPDLAPTARIHHLLDEERVGRGAADRRDLCPHNRQAEPRDRACKVGEQPCEVGCGDAHDGAPLVCRVVHLHAQLRRRLGCVRLGSQHLLREPHRPKPRRPPRRLWRPRAGYCMQLRGDGHAGVEVAVQCKRGGLLTGSQLPPVGTGWRRLGRLSTALFGIPVAAVITAHLLQAQGLVAPGTLGSVRAVRRWHSTLHQARWPRLLEASELCLERGVALPEHSDFVGEPLGTPLVVEDRLLRTSAVHLGNLFFFLHRRVFQFDQSHETDATEQEQHE